MSGSKPKPAPTPDMVEDALAGILSKPAQAMPLAIVGQPIVAPAPRPYTTGRPTGYTPELGARIVEELRLGRTMVEIVDEDWAPSLSMVYRWIDASPELREMVARARALGAEVMAERALHIADTADDTTKGGVQKARLRADVRFRSAGVYDKRFAERQIVTHENQEPSNAKDLGTANLAQLAQQLAKLLTQAGAIDVDSQPVDVPQVSDKTGKSG